VTLAAVEVVRLHLGAILAVAEEVVRLGATLAVAEVVRLHLGMTLAAAEVVRLHLEASLAVAEEVVRLRLEAILAAEEVVRLHWEAAGAVFQEPRDEARGHGEMVGRLEAKAWHTPFGRGLLGRRWLGARRRRL